MKTIFIPITDHNDGITCTQYYNVRFKRETDINWVSLPQQQAVMGGSPAGYGIWIDPLDASTDYEYEVIRMCCNGVLSTAATGTVNTGA